MNGTFSRPLCLWRAFWASAFLGFVAIASNCAAELVERWNPELVTTVKMLPMEELFAQYKTGHEFSSRSQEIYFHEIVERTNAVDFLCGKLKKDRLAADTKERIDAREKAAHLMGKMGERAKPGVPLLIAALEDEDDVRRQVTSAFADLGPVAIEAEQALLEELHFQNTEAARALFKIDPTSEEVLSAVIERVSDPSMEVGFRLQTMEAFYECKVKSDHKKKFLEEVASGPTGLADSAKRQLGMMPSKLQRYAPPKPPPTTETNATVLLERLRSNPDDRMAAESLAKLGHESRAQAVQILMDALEQKRLRYAINALSMLSFFGTDAKPALPILIKFAEGDEYGPANNAIATIGEIGPASNSIEAIGELASDATKAKRVVEAALHDPNPLLRWRAANTLCLIDPDKLEQHLIQLLEALQSEGADYRAYGIRSLGKFGTRAKQAVPMLTGLLESETLGTSAADALLKIQPDSNTKRKVARALARKLKDESVYERDSAAKLLGEIGSEAAEVLPELREAARSNDLEFANTAKEAIDKIEGGKKEGI
jgi:HEAT repeat protein